MATWKKSLIWIGISLCLAGLAFAAWLIREASIGRDNDLFRLIRATPYGDKIGHVALAATLTFVLSFFLRFRCWRPFDIPLPMGAAIAAALMAAEELSQHFVPTRELDLQDALANFVGILLVAIPMAILTARRAKPPSRP